ncbi:MAG: transglycosylase SLT domain-containing protein [Pseudomonadota bacterium]
MPRTYPVRPALVAVVCAVLTSCGGGSNYSNAPSSQHNVCAIFDQRPGWKEAVEASAAKWGAPVPVQMAIIWRESSFRADVRPPERYTLGIIPKGPVSSAYGYAQAIDGTWDWYREATGNSGADRTDWDDATDFVGWYMSRSQKTNGIGMNDAYNQYLAYHEGHAGHRRGSYRAKTWLVAVAEKVSAQAARYRGQLRDC